MAKRDTETTKLMINWNRDRFYKISETKTKDILGSSRLISSCSVMKLTCYLSNVTWDRQVTFTAHGAVMFFI